jgi:hypothetical protein
VRLRSRLIPAVAALGLVLAACNGDDTTTEDGVVEDTETTDDEATDDETDATEDDATEDESALDDDADVETDVDAHAETGETASGLELADHEQLGQHLVDDAGNTVYINIEHTQANGDAEAAAEDDAATEDEGDAEEGDAEEAGPVRCEADCAQVWPPVLGDTDIELGDGLDEQLLGTVEREDGSTQLTYNGWPLHYFVADDAGEANGQGLGGTWFVVGPDGEALGTDDVPAPVAEGDDDEGDDA